MKAQKLICPLKVFPLIKIILFVYIGRKRYTTTDTNIIEISCSENVESMVNKVKIYNEENQYLSVVQNDELVGSFYIEADEHEWRNGQDRVIMGMRF